MINRIVDIIITSLEVSAPFIGVICGSLLCYGILLLVNKPCNHEWVVSEKSNVIQFDDMGYPLRLFICKCSKCGISDQRWIDISKRELDEVDTGKSFILQWEKIN